MKKPVIILALLAVITLSLAACASQPDPTLTAADYLDLGEKYLLNLDYEQALVQFLKVIEIEPMNSRGYTGAAEAYIGLDRFDDAIAILEQGLTVLPDNEDIQDKLNLMPIDIDPANPQSYIDTAETYIGLGRIDDAKAILEQGLLAIPDNADLQGKLTEMNESEYKYDAAGRLTGRTRIIYDNNADGSSNGWREYEFNADGKEIKLTIYRSYGLEYWKDSEYDTAGRLIKSTIHRANGSVEWSVYEQNSDGEIIKSTNYRDGSMSGWNDYEYDVKGNMSKEIQHFSNGPIRLVELVYEYDDNGKIIKQTDYYDSVMTRYTVSEYDGNGNYIGSISYNADGSINSTSAAE